MRSVVIPQPPNPDDWASRANAQAFARAQYEWMCKVKAAIETASRINDRPMAQQFAVGSFTTNTTITGTSTLADVANFVASLVTAMEEKGFSSQTVNRTNG